MVSTTILLQKHANQDVFDNMAMKMQDIHIKKKRIVDGHVLALKSIVKRTTISLIGLTIMKKFSVSLQKMTVYQEDINGVFL
jgi:hypothetical protein